MEITDKIVNRMVSIRKMSILDPSCYFLVCQETKVFTIRYEDKEAFDNKNPQDNNVGYYKQGKYFPIKS
jgi:hypothetical protein